MQEELELHRALAAAEQQECTGADVSGSGSSDALLNSNASSDEWQPHSNRIGEPLLLHPLHVRSLDPLPTPALDCFPPSRYFVSTSSSPAGVPVASVMVQQHQLLDEQVRLARVCANVG